MCEECEYMFPFLDPQLVLAEIKSRKRCARCFSTFLSNQSTEPSKCGTRKQHKFVKHCERANPQY
jgi:hypothetical protein